MSPDLAMSCLLVVFPFLLAYAASSDLLTMTIPNWVSLTLLAAFAALTMTSNLSWADLGLHIAAAGLTLCAAFTLFAFGVIGGGDAKFATATTLWLGLGSMLDYLLVASLLGGVLTVGLLLLRSQPLPLSIQRLPFAVHLHDRKTGVPYGIALAASGLIVAPHTALWGHVMSV